jgi:hypothetical protein
MSSLKMRSFTAKYVKSSVVGDYMSVAHKNSSLTHRLGKFWKSDNAHSAEAS